jgi:hypothetical protein
MKMRVLLLCGAMALLHAGCQQDRREAPASATVLEKEPARATGEAGSLQPPAETAAAAPSGSPNEVARPAETAEANITISSVNVTNPLVVSGLARTFENNVSLRVRDSRGAVIAEGFTTATGEMGTHSPYRATLWITRDPGAEITVQALEYSARDGSEQSLVSVKRPFAVETVPVRLYFPDKSCTGVRPYTRRVPKSVSAARLLVEALINGPTPEERVEGAQAPFPQHSAVESINLRNGTVTVNFNERLQNVGGSCVAEMIRSSVTSTMRSLPAVTKVVITAGGSETLALQP